MAGTSATQLCQKLKAEAVASQDESKVNALRLRILDYLIAHNVPDDVFEEVLEARLNDPDPAKEQSRVICAEILEEWRTGGSDTSGG